MGEIMNIMKDVIEGQPKPPCDKFICKFRLECAANLMCCKAFDVYVDTGRALHPSFDAGYNRQGKYTDRVSPSRKMYDRVYRNKDDGENMSWVMLRDQINAVQPVRK